MIGLTLFVFYLLLGYASAGLLGIALAVVFGGLFYRYQSKIGFLWTCVLSQIVPFGISQVMQGGVWYSHLCMAGGIGWMLAKEYELLPKVVDILSAMAAVFSTFLLIYALSFVELLGGKEGPMLAQIVPPFFGGLWFSFFFWVARQKVRGEHAA